MPCGSSKNCLRKVHARLTFHKPYQRHGRAANIAFADGHAEIWRWRATRKFSGDGLTGIKDAADRADFKRFKDAIPNP
jgi:prepilin-type processing-associated H-X9-DG protein